MHKHNAHKYLPLVQALADGKTIQIRDAHGKWVDSPSPRFGLDPESYRVKSEPKEIWVNEYKGCCSAHLSKDDAMFCTGPEVRRVAVLYREVVED